MKASDFIASFLSKKGIESVFELSGGMITHILDSLNQTTDIKIITMHHEQAAAFAAEGYGRVTGVPGVALATSGPGATNLLTGIGSCFFDSTPAIFITGQVNTHEQKGEREIRQLGFQETDIVSMAKPITKACFLVNDPNELEEVFEKAFALACHGRPGPVLIDIPMNVQRAQIDVKDSPPLENEGDVITSDYAEIIRDIKNAKRPLILAGRGIKAAKAQSHFDKFVSTVNVPVCTTLLGLDTISFDDDLRVGFIGSYGNRWANIAFGECDLLIVLGSRLDIRQTGADTKFIENRKIYHVDCERGELNNRITGCVAILADLNVFFTQFEKQVVDDTFSLQQDWIARIDELKALWPDVKELDPKGINPNKFMHHLSHAGKQQASVYLADVGSHQMWAAQSLELYKGQHFLTSGGMGAMGFSLPAGIGACIALNNKPVVVIVGDGCMQINIQELQTIVRNKLSVKIIVLNNNTLGMIRQFQDSYFESRYQSTYWGYSAPDFSKIAVAYGIEAMTIENPEEMEDGVNWLWTEENSNKPQLLQVMIDPHTNTYPKIAFGKPITEMEPFSKPIEMEGT